MTYYAMTRWAPEDVRSLRPCWTPERCEEELQTIERHLENRLVELGFDVLDTLLPQEGK